MANKQYFSKKIFAQTVLPFLNDIVDNKYKVFYVKNTKMEFQAYFNDGNEPFIGQILIHKGMKYNVVNINNNRGIFTAEFSGFNEVSEQQNREPELVEVI